MGNRLNPGLLPLFGALALLLALQVRAETSTDPFPQPDTLRPAVEFWKKVFTKWSRGQVALHDNVHLGLVYEVIDLPGRVGEGQTDEQRYSVEARRERLVRELGELETKIRDQQPLSDQEKALYDRLTYEGEAGAVYGAADRVRVQRGMRERFKEGVRISGRYDATLRRIFRSAGLPEELSLLPHVESSFQTFALSSVGAAGIWQFTRPAAQPLLTMNAAVDERLDPIIAGRGAAGYLGSAYARLGDWALAVTSYNHGVGGMSRAKAEFGTDFGRIVREYRGPAFGFASRNFYAEFLAVREIMASLDGHFPEGALRDPPMAHRSVVLNRPYTVPVLARAYGVGTDTIVDLNPALTKAAVSGRVRLPAGTEVWLPSGSALASLPREEEPPAARADTASGASALRTRTGQGRAHVVRKGETPGQIAARYDVAVADLLAHNRLSARQPVKVGQRLRIPGGGDRIVARAPEPKEANLVEAVARVPAPADSREGRTHTVARGESPGYLAALYRVKLDDLLAANKLKRNATLTPGQRLRIPGLGEKGEAAAKETKPVAAKPVKTDGGKAKGSSAKTHVVREGESPQAIATRYRVRIEDLMAMNDITRKTVIFPGQRLRIPQTRVD